MKIIRVDGSRGSLAGGSTTFHQESKRLCYAFADGFLWRWVREITKTREGHWEGKGRGGGIKDEYVNCRC